MLTKARHDKDVKGPRASCLPAPAPHDYTAFAPHDCKALATHVYTALAPQDFMALAPYDSTAPRAVTSGRALNAENSEFKFGNIHCRWAQSARLHGPRAT